MEWHIDECFPLAAFLGGSYRVISAMKWFISLLDGTSFVVQCESCCCPFGAILKTNYAFLKPNCVFFIANYALLTMECAF